jgi:hypothetical protein
MFKPIRRNEIPIEGEKHDEGVCMSKGDRELSKGSRLRRVDSGERESQRIRGHRLVARVATWGKAKGR